MNIRHSRFLIIIFIAAIPFLIAGLFVYRNVFPDGLSHPARNIFLNSSIIPAAGSIILALMIQIPYFRLLREDGNTPKFKLISILTGLALIPILWGSIIATEAWLRSAYIGLWGALVREISPLSVSSILAGIAVSIVVISQSILSSTRMESA